MSPESRPCGLSVSRGWDPSPEAASDVELGRSLLLAFVPCPWAPDTPDLQTSSSKAKVTDGRSPLTVVNSGAHARKPATFLNDILIHRGKTASRRWSADVYSDGRTPLTLTVRGNVVCSRGSEISPLQDL